MEKKLKIALIILVMALIIVISFGGVYVKKLVAYNNSIPDYNLGLKLEGSRVAILKVGDHVHEVIYDSEGNEVDEIPEGADESQYRKEEVPENSEEAKTKENYKKSKDIMLERLQSLGISDYEVRLDEESGNIFVELADTEDTDTILADLLASGKFEIVDTNDGTVLMTNDDLAGARVLYNTTNSGVSVYLDIEFTKDGKQKMREISKEYREVEETEGTEGEETNEESTEKTVTIKINDENFLSTHFDEEISELTITIGSASTDSDAITQYVEQAQFYAALLSNEEMPLEYETETTDYIQSIYANSIYVYVLLGIIALIVLVSIVYMIIRYKISGLLSSIVYVATIALLLIAIRYISAEITLETIVFGGLLALINTYVNCTVLKSLGKSESREDVKGKIFNAYLKVVDLLIIVLIASVVFTYNSFSAISSIGVILFWGILTIILMNVLFTRTLLIKSRNK